MDVEKRIDPPSSLLAAERREKGKRTEERIRHMRRSQKCTFSPPPSHLALCREEVNLKYLPRLLPPQNEKGEGEGEIESEFDVSSIRIAVPSTFADSEQKRSERRHLCKHREEEEEKEEFRHLSDKKRMRDIGRRDPPIPIVCSPADDPSQSGGPTTTTTGSWRKSEICRAVTNYLLLHPTQEVPVRRSALPQILISSK